MQRRHQKLIEETPSPILNDKIRKDLFEKTVNMVQKLGYEGAGNSRIYLRRWKILFFRNEYKSSGRTSSY